MTLDLTLNSLPFYKETQDNLEGESSSLSEVAWTTFHASLQQLLLFHNKLHVSSVITDSPKFSQLISSILRLSTF